MVKKLVCSVKGEVRDRAAAHIRRAKSEEPRTF